MTGTMRSSGVLTPDENRDPRREELLEEAYQLLISLTPEELQMVMEEMQK